MSNIKNIKMSGNEKKGNGMNTSSPVGARELLDIVFVLLMAYAHNLSAN